MSTHRQRAGEQATTAARQGPRQWPFPVVTTTLLPRATGTHSGCRVPPMPRPGVAGLAAAWAAAE